MTETPYPTLDEALTCVDWSEPYDGCEYETNEYEADYGKGTKTYVKIVITDNNRQRAHLVAVEVPTAEDMKTLRQFCPCSVCIDERDRRDARWFELRYWFSPNAWGCRGCMGCIKNVTEGVRDSHGLEMVLDARVLIKRSRNPK